MSVPGAPPETSDRGYESPEEEDQLPLNARPTTSLFDSNIPTVPQSAPMTTDERFMPGTAPNMAGQITPPDDLTPGRFTAPAPTGELPPEASPTRQKYAAAPSVTQTDAVPGQKLPPPTANGPKSYTSLLSPVPIAKQEYGIRRRDDKFYKGQLDIEPEREQTRQIKGGVPSVRALKGTLSPNAQSWFEFAVAPRDQGGLGLGPAGAAGLVANLTHESGQQINPNAVGDNGASVGAAQWQKGRRTALERLPNARSTHTQQRHMHNELNGPYRAVYERLLRTKTPEEAALVFGKGYEGYGDTASTPYRIATAKKIFSMMSGGSASVVTPNKVSIDTKGVEPVYGPNLTPDIELAETAGPKVQPRPFSLLSPVPAAEQVIPIGKPQGRLARAIATEPDTIANLKYKFQKAKDFVPTTQRIITTPQAPQPFQTFQPPNAATVIEAPTTTNPTTGGQTEFVPQEQPLTHPQTGKPLLNNRDGSVSTERTITVTDDQGKFHNIPTIINGKRRTNQYAFKRWKEGKLSSIGPAYDTLDEATSAAKQRSEDLGRTLPPEVQQDVPITIKRGSLPEDTGARSVSSLPYNKQAGPGPVYAPAGTPAEELESLSQTTPWKRTTRPRSWEKYEPVRPVTSTEPSKMLPRRPLDPAIKELIDIQRGKPTFNPEVEAYNAEVQNQRMLAEENAINAMEPTFEQPLFAPRPDTLPRADLPLAPPDTPESPVPQELDPLFEQEKLRAKQELSTSPPTITYSDNVTPISPVGVTQARFKFVVPQQDISVDEAGNPGMNPVQTGQWKEDLSEITRASRWFGHGLVSGAGQLPYLLAAGAASLGALPRAMITGEVSEADQKDIGLLLGLAEKTEQASKRFFGFGAEEKAEGAEWVDRALGESLFPASKLRYFLAGTALMAGARGLIDPNSPFSLMSEAGAAEVQVRDRQTKRGKGKKVKSEAETGQDNRIHIPEVPGQIAQGNIIAGTIPGTAFGTVIPHPDEPGQIILIPNHNLYGKHALTPDQAIKQFGMTGLNFGTFSNAEAANKYLEVLNARVSQTVQAASGQTQLRTQDLAVLGTIGALTIGMAGGPHLVRVFTQGKLPRTLPADRGRALEIGEGPQNTYAFTSHKDYLRAINDNFHAPKFANLKRVGASPEEITRFENAFYGHTRGAATNIAQSAVVSGRAHTPEFNFELPSGVKPLGDLQRFDGPEVRQYLYLWNTLDEVNAVKAIPAQGPVQPGRGAVTVGPPKIRDLDEVTIKQEIRAAEAANPALRDIRLDMIATKNEVLRVESQGQWATRTQKDANKIATEEANIIKYSKDKGHLEVSPFESQAGWVNQRLRNLMENQANGQYIEFMKTARPNMFKQVTAEDLKQHPSWKKNTIRVYEYGKPKYYTTDPLLASTMKMDPHFFSNPSWNKAMAYASAPKRIFETATTGWANLSPFALVNGPRNFVIQQLTARSHGLTPAGPFAATAGIARNLIPQFTNAAAKSIDYGVIHQLLGPRMPAWVDALGKRWAATYLESTHAQLQAHGAHYGSAFDYREAAKTVLGGAIQQSTGKMRIMLNTYKNILSAIHDAAPIAVVSKNMWRTKLHPSDPRYVSMFEMARKKRALTGDPTIQGELFGGSGPVRMHTQGAIDKIGAEAVRMTGVAAEAGRLFMPWFNPIQQGVTSLAKAYWTTPATATAKLWGVIGLPTALAYMWNSSLGLDPQGQPYVMHQIQGRSPYNTMLNWYLGIPGRPAAEGWEIPGKVPEVAIVGRLTEIIFDHLLRDPSQSWKGDFEKMIDQWLGVVSDMPIPPVANTAFLAPRGISTTGGAFLGDSYKRRDAPYDQNAGLPVNLEMTMRAAFGGAADMFSAATQAAMQEESPILKPKAFVKEAVRNRVQGAAFLRNIFDMTPPASGNTQVTDEMYKYRGVINKLDEFYRRYGYGGGMQLSNKPASKEGGPLVEGHLGPPAPEIAPGLPQPSTTNPLYNTYMQMVHQAITRDKPSEGGMGYKSALKQFYKTNKELSTLRNITGSNYGVWQLWVNDPKNAPLKEFLVRHNVDHTNKVAVQNFYQLRRQNAANVILHMFKSVENDIRVKTGNTKFDIKQLDPYLKINDIADWTPKNTVLDIISGEYFGGVPASTGGMPPPGSMNPE